ncbi:GRB2-associated-binding protein 3 [Chelonia mydas]|uniref:GRB2-associated-binding protein 3 n=1 Tax=Chelonia mydas TaxID=8469 RepID=M7BE17_CHEMY|nr:GRB2-associated-binding protein 3 [Chelonia mydas]
MSSGDVVCTGWLIKSPPEKKLKRYWNSFRRRDRKITLSRIFWGNLLSPSKACSKSGRSGRPVSKSHISGECSNQWTKGYKEISGTPSSSFALGTICSAACENAYRIRPCSVGKLDCPPNLTVQMTKEVGPWDYGMLLADS